MSRPPLDKLLDWMKGTDLVEVHYARGGETFGLTLAGESAPAELPPSRLMAAASPAVGVFRAAAPGRPAAAQKGSKVAAKAVLGWVESGKGRVEVASPAAGHVAEVLSKDGDAVEYGRPLFLIEPA